MAEPGKYSTDVAVEDAPEQSAAPTGPTKANGATCDGEGVDAAKGAAAAPEAKTADSEEGALSDFGDGEDEKDTAASDADDDDEEGPVQSVCYALKSVSRASGLQSLALVPAGASSSSGASTRPSSSASDSDMVALNIDLSSLLVC